MDRNADGEGSESRFASYVEQMASTLGHADCRTPFRFYCTGLILPGERKSVEPIAARVEPRRVQGAHQSLHHFVANADWSQEDLLRRVRTFVLPAIEKSGRPGSSTTRDSPRRAFIRSASPGNIADNSASRTIVRSRSRCRQPTSTQARRSAFGSTFPKIGQSIRFAGPEPACPRTSCLRPNRKSPLTRSRPRAPRACRRASCWRTPVTGSIRRSEWR